MAEYPDGTQLKHRLRRACLDEQGPPVTVVAGAGISVGAVPSSAEMVNFFRSSIAADPEDLKDFDLAVELCQPQDRYQRAAGFLIDRAGLTHLNIVIRGAVLRARAPRLAVEVAHEYVRDTERLRDLEEDLGGWALPQGVRALGKIYGAIAPQRRGPILTTNFDPLIEVSLRLAGIEPFPVLMDSDGSAIIPELPSGFVPVVHLHGGWRHGDTLHTGAQLKAERPRLLGSLRRIMSSATCLVIGYGGWDDVFTASLGQLVAEGYERDLELLWACHGDVADLGALTPGVVPGRIQPYVGVDANSLLPAVEEAVGLRRPRATAEAATSRREVAIQGLTLLDNEFMASHAAVDTNRHTALTFFDGREPTWVDVVLRRAPVLEVATGLIGSVTRDWAQMKPLTLLVGPTGEGKSTALLQAAHELSRRDDFLVYWLEPAATPNFEDLANLSQTSLKKVLIVDDADLRVPDLASLASKIQKRPDFRILAAARDTDWNRSTARAGVAASLGALTATRLVNGITLQDAELIIEAWAEFGVEGLGRLALLPDDAARAANLLAASSAHGESALLGALLETRYGEEFKHHVRELLLRLRRISLPGGKDVGSAYGLMCIISDAGLAPLTIEQLSHAQGLSIEEAISLVVRRLGMEAAASRHGDKVVVRHPKIAAVAAKLLPELGLEPRALLTALMRAVFRERSGLPMRDEDVRIIYCSQSIANEDLALAAAWAAVDAAPEQIRLRTNLIAQFRRFGRNREAAEVSREIWAERERYRDLQLAGRNFLREWSRSEGSVGRWEHSAALNACGMLDAVELGDVESDGLSRVLSGLAYSLNVLAGANTKGIDDAWIVCLAEDAVEVTSLAEIREQAGRTLDMVRSRYSDVVPDGEARRKLRREAVHFALGRSDLDAVVSLRRLHGRQLTGAERLLD